MNESSKPLLSDSDEEADVFGFSMPGIVGIPSRTRRATHWSKDTLNIESDSNHEFMPFRQRAKRATLATTLTKNPIQQDNLRGTRCNHCKKYSIPKE